MKPDKTALQEKPLRPQDLRIGNLVEWEGDSYPISLICDTLIKIDIGDDASQRIEKNPIWSPALDELKPIPITPELLERAGFDNRGGVWWIQYHLENWGIQLIYFNNEYIVRQGFMGGFKEIAHVKYWHELQNLYFALTGNELEFKDKYKSETENK